MPKSKKPQPVSRPGKPPQTIRGGFIVVRRQEETGRLLTMHGTAYEHASAEAAQAQAAILAERFGCEFAVFHQIGAALPPAQPVAVDEKPVIEPSLEPVAEPRGDRRRTLTLRKAVSPS